MAAKLTPRQRQVVRLFATGKTDKQIGLELGISPHTVAVHIASVSRRAGVTSRGQLLLGLHQQRNKPPVRTEPPLPEGWKAYLRAFDRLLTARGETVPKAALQMAHMRDAALIDERRQQLTDGTHTPPARPLEGALPNLRAYRPVSANP